MINIADVIKMRVPFPNIDSSLAVKAHMYICIQKQNGNDKEFIKCQTFKPTHLINDSPPRHFLIENPNNNRNPFINKTTIDCDKSFLVCRVIIDRKLLATRNICNDLLNSIINAIKHNDFFKENLNSIPLCNINSLINLNNNY